MSLPPPTPGQARVIWFALSALGAAVIVGVVAAAVWGLGKTLELLSPVLWPLAVAGVIACLLDPVVDFIERRGASRTRAIVLVFSLAAVMVLGLVGSVVPQVVRETGQLMEKAPDYSAKLQRRVQEWINNPPPLLRKFLQLQPRISPIANTNSIPGTGAISTSTNSAAEPGPA